MGLRELDDIDSGGRFSSQMGSSKLGGVLGQQGAAGHLLTVWASSWAWKQSTGCAWFSDRHGAWSWEAVGTAGSAAGAQARPAPAASEDGQAADPQGQDTECLTAPIWGSSTSRQFRSTLMLVSLASFPRSGQGPQWVSVRTTLISSHLMPRWLWPILGWTDGQLRQLTRPPRATAAGPGAAAGQEQRQYQPPGSVQPGLPRPGAPGHGLLGSRGSWVQSSHRPSEGSTSTSLPPRFKGHGRRQGLEQVQLELQGHQVGEVAQVAGEASARLGHSGPGEPG